MNYGNTSVTREKKRLQQIARNVILGKIDVIFVTSIHKVEVK